MRAVRILLCALLLGGCSRAPREVVAPVKADPADLDRHAAELARSLVVVDTHIDLPYRLQHKPDDVSVGTATGDFDHPRALRGGLDVAFMSIYVPASYQTRGGARAFADELIDMVEGLAAQHPQQFTLVTSAAQARQRNSSGDGQVGLALGMENGAPVEDDLANLAHFHRRGIRYITLTHSKNNAISDSSFDTERRWNGLSPFGREVVAEMNRLGIMVDVSHVSDAAMRDVLAIARAPVIASHSSCRHFTPGWERNIDDELIREVAAGGGVVQINFGSSFVDDAHRRQAELLWKAVTEHFTAQKIDPESDAAEAYRTQYFKEHPIPFADVATVADHVDHVVKLVGVDHVGFGSDFDGVGDSLPTGLKSVADYPNLIRVLLERGYSDADLEKICGGNLLRVWDDVERQAGGNG